MGAALPLVEIAFMTGTTAYSAEESAAQANQAAEQRKAQQDADVKLQNQAIDQEKQQTSAAQDKEISNVVQ